MIMLLLKLGVMLGLLLLTLTAVLLGLLLFLVVEMLAVRKLLLLLLHMMLWISESLRDPDAEDSNKHCQQQQE